jgi:hypothetical protein
VANVVGTCCRVASCRIGGVVVVEVVECRYVVVVVGGIVGPVDIVERVLMIESSRCIV